VGALRTSEEGGEVVGGEAKPIRSDDDGRRVDAPGQIIIDSAPIAATAPPAPSMPVPGRRPASHPVAPPRAGGLGLVVVVYILAAGALAAAIYERFLM
jgi:hypothetical protein